MIGTEQKILVSKIDFDASKPVLEDVVRGLISSINDNGMLHRITVESIEGGRFRLIAGRHRLEAHRRSKWEYIDALIVPKNLSDDERLELHIHENIRRHNMPWYEEVEMEKALHDLRQRQFGKATVGRGKVGWSLRDTAKELNTALGVISEDLRLAEAIIHDPSLRNVQDKTTAMKLVKEEAKRIEQRMVSDVSPREDNQIYLGESGEVLSHLEAGTFDACITDPPWLNYKDENLRKDDLTLLVFKKVYRLLRHNAFLYMFVSTPDFFIYQQELPKFGFTVQTYPLIWIKTNMFSYGLRSWEYSRDYEPILLAVKGSPALSEHRQMSAVFTYPVVPPAKLIHPNEKPVGLLEKILQQCTFDNSLILDPFAGSGVTLQAARNLGRSFVGVERDYKFHEGIVRRLNK